MRLSQPEITREKEAVTYRVRVESGKGRRTLWYSLEDPFGDLLTQTADAALVALLAPAMAMGEDIHVEGVVSDRLFYNLSHRFQRLLQHIMPSLRRVKILPQDVCSHTAQPTAGVGTGFSGGVDSYCVLADHYYSDVPERFRVTHAVFNNVNPNPRRVNRKRYERLLPAARRVGLPLVWVDSNLSGFYVKKLRKHQQTHVLRNGSVALLLQGGLGRYMYASTYKYSDVFVGPTHAMGYSDCITLPLLSTNAMDIFSVGNEYSRVEKTLRVAELPESYETLNICVNANNASDYANCGVCWKCLRTLATLEIAGYLERYAAAFDLSAYQRVREMYLATLFTSHKPLLQEIVQFARERGYSFPASSRRIHNSGTAPIMKPLLRGLREIRNLTKRLT